PDSYVAEVILARSLDSAISSPFLLGMLTWREQSIPIVSYEGMRDQRLPSDISLHQITIVNGFVDRKKMPFYGVVSHSMPSLQRLRTGDVEPLDEPHSELVHSRVSCQGKAMSLLDWDAVEKAILAELYTEWSLNC
ncbi:MAG: hypothetical protein ACSHWQ_04220, partial [Spongiibacteraceae bacterium]